MAEGETTLSADVEALPAQAPKRVHTRTAVRYHWCQTLAGTVYRALLTLLPLGSSACTSRKQLMRPMIDSALDTTRQISGCFWRSANTRGCHKKARPRGTVHGTIREPFASKGKKKLRFKCKLWYGVRASLDSIRLVRPIYSSPRLFVAYPRREEYGLA